MDDTSAVDPATRCCLCHRILSSEIDTIGDLEAMNICRDCKFIFFENTHTTQTRYNNNNNRIESIENIPSQQFPDMQPTISNRLNQSTQPMSVLSDSGSDSYDSVLGNDEFEEVENTVEGYVGTIQLHRSLATNGRNLPADWLSEIFSDEGIRNNERIRLFGILDEPELEPSGYIDAETAGSRLGAPPAAVWFVKNLERVVVDEPGLVCVICKDGACVGSVVNRLPCGHVYHPSCIVPWLNARSTCPLCRYELPTDDKDRSHWEEMPRQRGLSPESGGGRWWFVAVPVLSVVGVSVVWWFGGGVFGNQREDRSSRRWWLLL